MIHRLAAGALLLVIAAACGQSQATPTTQAIVLGAIYPLSGPQAPGGKDELAGVQAALKVAEAEGAPNVRLQVID
ncbi:MAG TPA: hypothetical protein VNF26_06810, partial [Candidatus Baltobacterales bacterium]|nr:hypothetical protein [Candidatus Baltobacterales bacterium]